MSSSSSQPMPGWYWPDDVPKDAPAGPSNEARGSPPSTSSDPPPRTGQSSRRRKHWPPRQCRICLDTVQPTTQAPSENLPNFLQGAPNVVYEDENGRLIRPCLCKGSSKYVHEACLQAWRHADPRYGQRNYYQCPTCGFKYRLARLGWGRWLTSAATQVSLTVVIMIMIVFVLGFIADPIINMYMDPWNFLSPFSRSNQHHHEDDEPVGWTEHFAKGFASMGVIGFLKMILASPIAYFRFGGGRGRTTARDRYEQISWIVILIGVLTFMAVIFKGVRAWTRRTLEKAGERVMDVQGDDDDDEHQ
ncbi:hypothetical protein B0J11DRAFT_436653 [Dendryphion nanum]|uniref:RING-CH-type domain-containing protein n=1 Tax=Dendryphion nanum TaxID=256645 RepID=A0A9P9DNR4_9PLEO|nr:hypothetical protein B0J11DRAFT_436653 [Dendryphion nanum]